MAVKWIPKQTPPDRKWGHATLVVETQRYVRAKQEGVIPPLNIGTPPAPAKPAAAPEPRAPGLQQRLRKTLPLSFILGGTVVLVLDLLPVDAPMDATFYLSLLYSLILIVQGLRLMTRLEGRA